NAVSHDGVDITTQTGTAVSGQGVSHQLQVVTIEHGHDNLATRHCLQLADALLDDGGDLDVLQVLAGVVIQLAEHTSLVAGQLSQGSTNDDSIVRLERIEAVLHIHRDRWLLGRGGVIREEYFSHDMKDEVVTLVLVLEHLLQNILVREDA